MSNGAPLRIGIDARELLGEATGVGRYLGELLRRWAVRDDAALRTLMLYTPEPLPFVKTLPSGVRLDEIVAGSGRGEIQVPLVHEICVGIDIEEKRIVIEPPEGLLDLNA